MNTVTMTNTTAAMRSDPKGNQSVSYAYEATGVDTNEADAGLSQIIANIKGTWPTEGDFKVLLDLKHFANVIDFGGIGLAICTDGVGSKSIIAEKMGRYDTIGIDCIAMNVNDLICVGAKPLSLVDYIAVEQTDSEMLGQIGEGLTKGANMAGISITGGEIAQLKDNIRGFDLVGTAVGRVDLDKLVIGRNIAEGDVVLGIKSNGIHCNGMTLARKAFLSDDRFKIDHRFNELDCSLGEELLKPTDIYVPEAMELLKECPGVKALINITSDGFLNLTRVESDVGYVIENLPDPHAIFGLIRHHADVPLPEMYEVFNMGVGFCVVVAEKDADTALAVLHRHGRDARRIGYAVDDPQKRVTIPELSLTGHGKHFVQD